MVPLLIVYNQTSTTTQICIESHLTEIQQRKEILLRQHRIAPLVFLLSWLASVYHTYWKKRKKKLIGSVYNGLMNNIVKKSA